MNKSDRPDETGSAEDGDEGPYVLVEGGFGFFDYMAVRQRIRDHAAVEGGPDTGHDFYLPFVTDDGEHVLGRIR